MTDASKLLGDAMCNFLNEKIKHEAVDYLHDIALTNVLCLDFLVCGEALPQLLTLRPPTLPIGGLLSLGKTYKGTYVRALCL